jgi:hypothetical protein
MGDLEKFMHEGESGLPVLVKAGLIPVQFETIHPFLEGNGRLGIAGEITGRPRHRLFVYEGFLKILNEGTEPLR